MKKIPLIKPFITDEIKQRVCEVLDSGYLTEGPVTREFEQSLKKYIGCGHVLATSNCTVGLEISLRALGVGPGDEVIVPDYTYPATASVVSIVGADTVIIDIDRRTMLIDYDALTEAITAETKAVIPVSIFGNPLDYDRLGEIRERYSVHIVEDAACSIGAAYRETRVGNLADISVFSFHPRKFITTGEGGAVTTNDYELAQWMNAYKHFGMGDGQSRSETVFEMIGSNYKMSNIQAAIGLVQMASVDLLLDRRAQLAQRYRELLKDKSEISFPMITPEGTHSWQSCCIFVEKRDHVISELRSVGVETQIGTYALHQHPAFRENRTCRIVGNMAGSRYAFEHCLTLPLYHDMTEAEQDYVVEQLLQVVQGRKVRPNS
jgi:perosamine synthetase